MPEELVPFESRDVIGELGYIGQTVDEGLNAQPRAELDRVRREQQEADAERKRAEDERRARLEEMRLADVEARAALTTQQVEQVTATQEEA